MLVSETCVCVCVYACNFVFVQIMLMLMSMNDIITLLFSSLRCSSTGRCDATRNRTTRTIHCCEGFTKQMLHNSLRRDGCPISECTKKYYCLTITSLHCNNCMNL